MGAHWRGHVPPGKFKNHVKRDFQTIIAKTGSKFKDIRIIFICTSLPLKFTLWAPMREITVITYCYHYYYCFET